MLGLPSGIKSVLLFTPIFMASPGHSLDFPPAQQESLNSLAE